MKTTYKTLEEIRAAVTAGTKVQWKNDGYTVSRNKWGDFNVLCSNGHCAGLTDDYKAEDFYSVAATEHPLFFTPITDLAGAKTLLRYLDKRGLTYHCEDDAHDIIDPVTGPLFTDEEADSLNARMQECLWEVKWPDHIDGPCGYAMALEPGYLEEIISRGEGGEDDDRKLAAEIEAERLGDSF